MGSARGRSEPAKPPAKDLRGLPLNFVPSFDPASAELSPIDDLAALVDGLPEALRSSAALSPPIENIVRQLEDDVRFTMNVIGYEADKSKAMIEESVGHVEGIGAASGELSGLAAAANEVAAALAQTTRRLSAATQGIVDDVAGAERFVAEARALTAEVAAGMSRLNEAVAHIDGVKHVMATIARQTNVLALNASIDAARAGPEGRMLGVLAGEVKSLAAKAQKATVEITTQIGALQAVARRSGGSVAKIGKLIRRIDPVVSSIRGSAQEQGFATEQAAARANETTGFVASVADKAKELMQRADIANGASKKAEKAGQHVVYALQRYAQRSTVYLRNSLVGNRREFERVPVKIPCSIVLSGVKIRATALDISLGGALLLIEGAKAKVGDRSRLSMVGVGDCPGKVVGVSELGVHFVFEGASGEVLARLDKVIAIVKRSDAAFIALVRDGAEEISRAFEDGIAFGEVELDDLITTAYRPIAGSDPVQHETNATSFYDRTLPEIVDKFWDAEPKPVFAVAADRNAYLPVHHPKYSQPQRPNDWHWNDLNCRNKRIMERWQMLVVARNAEPCLVKVFLRHMSGGEIVPIKVFASPIYVRQKLWGNFQMSYFY